MKHYRIFFPNGSTFDIRADTPQDAEDCVRFYTKGDVTSQFIKANISGWAEVRRDDQTS